MAQPRNPGGRPTGMGTYGGWLATAKPGAVYWSDRPMRSLVSQAHTAKIKVSVKRYFAVSDQLDAVKLVRVEVLAQD